MKAEYLQAGNNLDYVNPSEDEAVEAGTVIALGSIVGIAATYIEPGETGSVATDGVWVFDTEDADTKQGDPVYYDDAADKATKEKKDTLLGICAYPPKDKKIAVKINACATAAAASEAV